MVVEASVAAAAGTPRRRPEKLSLSPSLALVVERKTSGTRSGESRFAVLMLRSKLPLDSSIGLAFHTNALELPRAHLNMYSHIRNTSRSQEKAAAVLSFEEPADGGWGQTLNTTLEYDPPT
jgi:hypothetical protein